MKVLFLDIWPPSNGTDAFKVLFKASLRANIHELKSTLKSYGDIEVVIIHFPREVPSSLLEDAISFVHNKIFQAAIVVLADEDDVYQARESIARGAQEYCVKESLSPIAITRLLTCGLASKKQQLEMAEYYQNTATKLSVAYNDLEKLLRLVSVDLRGALKKLHVFADLIELNAQEALARSGGHSLKRIQA